MDLGCLDLGCISVSDKQSNEATALDSENRNEDSNDPITASSKIGKKKSLKDTSSSTLNKFTSQIKKPSHHKNSPINWFPRKKVDSYLNRKIKMLQQVDGLNRTLDETLCGSNPHYSKVLREKIAAREASQKAIESRKSALVEASWCRILRASRIQSKEAEDQLLRAEKFADEAFEEAKASGIIMYDHLENAFETTASFETAFEVDKEVAAAVKIALLRLADNASFEKDEFKQLLRKMSQNADENNNNNDDDDKQLLLPQLEMDTTLSQKRKRSHEREESKTKMVDVMTERLKGLQEKELSSLASVVVTCGLNAALAEVENSKFQHDHGTHLASGAGPISRKQGESELRSLDKFLVKHVTKLEREVQEAKNCKRIKSTEGVSVNLSAKEDVEEVLSLDKFLVKHVSRLEREVREAKNRRESEEKENIDSNKGGKKGVSVSWESLDKVLVKPVSRLEKDKMKARLKDEKFEVKKNKRNEKEVNEEEEGGLVKHRSRLEREKSKNEMKHCVSRRETRDRETQQAWGELSLGNSMKPHLSKLERDKVGFSLISCGFLAAWIKAEEEERRQQAFKEMC